ncbi:MAG: hypothetical protein M0Z45_06485 [Actinomycetota bacterium]|nr:hypothetical protein [Actinomycetota bacterium]
MSRPLRFIAIIILIAGATFGAIKVVSKNTSSSSKVATKSPSTTAAGSSASKSKNVSTSKGVNASNASVTLPKEMTKALTPAVLAPGSNPSVLPGPILIADRSNNRLIVVNPQGSIVWEFPRPGDLAPGQTFNIPDDSFFTPDGKYIIATEEDDFVISVISIAKHKIIYRYGTPGQSGMGPNQLWNPDDAMMLPDGYIISPDIKNCRILLLHPGDPSPVHIYGLSTNACLHNPPLRFGSPNGAFPMTNGHYVVTEINGDWINEMGIDGTIYQSFHAPGILYPSDTNEVSPGVFLTADYSNPGTVEEFTSSGQVLWRYSPTGVDALNQPSLALPLPNGDVALNDDKNNRVIVVDPTTNKVVWQYGTGIAGNANGQLNNPDGIDLAPPFSLLVTKTPYIGQPQLSSLVQSSNTISAMPTAQSTSKLSVEASATLPAPTERSSVVATKNGLMNLGGLNASGTSTASTYSIDLITKSKSKTISVKFGPSTNLQIPSHDAAAAFLGNAAYLFGGGQASTIGTVEKLQAGAVSVTGNLPKPRSDLSLVQTQSTAYLVGGYNGSVLDPNVLSTTNGQTFNTVGQIVYPVRYGAAALFDGTMYIFGGESGGTVTTNIQAINLESGQSEIVGQLPVALQGASADVLNGKIYVIGGATTSGSMTSGIYQFDPTTAMVTVAGNLPTPLGFSGSSVYGDHIVIVGGETSPTSLSAKAYVLGAFATKKA